MTRKRMVELFQKCPIPDDEILANLGLFINSKNLSRFLFMDHIYRQIIDVPGVIFEFGVRWGQNTALLAALRGIYDPFNRHRKIIAFDTFKGFPSISKEDGASNLMKKGKLAVTKDYVNYLSQLIDVQEKDNPLGHIKKYELIAGDATQQVGKYIKKHPETIVALAYFDFDVYAPTKKCLEAIKFRIVKGSVLAFDELNDPDSPGETIAVMEALGLSKIRLKRYRYASRVSYCVVE
jgi:hypothetical protein